MSNKKYEKERIERHTYPGDFSWLTFYSPSNESGVKTDDYIKRIAECTNSEIINLSGNNLYKNPNLLIGSVQVVQDSAHTIDLSFNNLYKLSNENWGNLCDRLPRHLSTVNFSNNQLGQWEFDTFKRNITLIPSSIRNILLYNTNFSYPEAEFQEFIRADGRNIATGPIPENLLGLQI